MELLKLDEIIKAIDGEIVLKGEEISFSGVSTDTRKIETGNIFFALKGDNFNGNNYVEMASEKGAFLCIVDEVLFSEEKLQKHTSVIRVENCRKALLHLAEFYRSMLKVKIVGVTGSTGKTSTKDLTAAALSAKYKVFKTEGNFNNEIGLPLMIFKLDNSYDVAVLEMGMNNLEEIHRMAKAARPDIALITNVGISHIENLKTRENILKAKMEITNFFDKNNILIINEDNDLLKNVYSDDFRVVKVGIENKGEYSPSEIQLYEDKVTFEVMGEIFEINFPGKHNVSNGLLSIACGVELGMNLGEIREGFTNLKGTGMRLDIIREESYTIVNDCYNASPDSMKAAIDVLVNIKGNRKIAVLGTMKELGEESYNAHKEIGRYAKEKGIDLLIALGEYSGAYEEGFDDKFRGFDSREEAAEFLVSHINFGDVLLFKASRAMKFEEIIEILRNKKA